MPRAVLLLLAFVAFAPALMAAAGKSAAGIESISSPLAPATPPAATSAPGLRLSEILFHPPAGAPGFVELLNAGAMDAALDGLTLANERGQTLALPSGLSPLAPDEILLVVFDGGDHVEGMVLHATPAEFLALDSGAVELRGADEMLLDVVAWGAGQADAVNLGRGGLGSSPGELTPGTTIGRAPATMRPGPLDWTIFGPAETTPGAGNPQPGVTVLLPLPGTILDIPSANLRWYPAPGAVEYRVQLTAEADAGFAAPLIDVTLSEPFLITDPLPPGRYLWRVQALGGDAPAAVSPAQSLEVSPVTAQGPGGLRAMPASLAQATQAKVLLVPLLAQRKDSRMLLIDRDVAESGPHAWDVVHPGTDMNDPADRSNCVLAVAAMINAFSGGRLSQDRIGFEIRGAAPPAGAAGDLKWNRTLQLVEVDRVLAFALGVSPGRIDVAGQAPDEDERDYFWDWVVAEIDAGRPLAVLVPDHAVVVAGYAVTDDGDRRLLINDPIGAQFNVVRLEQFRLLHYYLTPVQVNARSDEPGVAVDSDGDGVVDFDESERFGTDPANPDSDTDKVKDKQDILASVFDPTYGYANYGIGRPDFDGDGLEMERDSDSDDYGGGTPGMGGCPDGMEDRNRDGKQDGAETSNFDPFDDRCLHARQVTDHATFTTYGPDADGIWVEWNTGGQIVLETWVTDVGEGRLEGMATYGGVLTNTIEREAPICGSQSWLNTQTQSGQDLTVTGTRQGDRVELILHGEIRYTHEGLVNGMGCETEPIAVDMTYDAADFIPTLAGELVDGRYENEEVIEIPQPLQGSITVHTLIEQKGQDDAGAPVG